MIKIRRKGWGGGEITDFDKIIYYINIRRAAGVACYRTPNVFDKNLWSRGPVET